eukprot:CAMPEP_0115547990 /NCGR_PEP_ID=MMETSP0271-20121206/93935_1 /TAXON_ID=71861 /ORGANISM="Scrippsiella trochoidea, Strain CCMP3099" /LENGTH=238 /DNA_ID=CAMNT_0002981447 /DNA_START=42 /DNA_END=759 /DNA_ORIENTATION=+
MLSSPAPESTSFFKATLVLMMSVSFAVTSSSLRAAPKEIVGRTCGGGMAKCVKIKFFGGLPIGHMPIRSMSAFLIRLKIVSASLADMTRFRSCPVASSSPPSGKEQIDKEAGLQVAATAAELGISFVLLGIWAIDVQVLVTLRVGNRSTSLLGTATQHHSLQLLLRAMEFHRIDHLVVSGISQKSGAIVANTSQHIVRGLHEAPMEHGPCERQVAPMPGAALDVLSARLTNRADVNRA